MKIVNIAHVSFPEERDPQAWITKSAFFKGIWEAVAQKDKVIFIDFIGYNGSIQKNGLEYRFLKRSRRALRLPWSVHRMIAAEDPDAVIVHGIQFPLQVLSLKWFLKKKCRLVVQDHGGTPLRHPVKKYLQRLADRCIDAYFFTAAAQAKKYREQGIIKEERKVKEVMEVASVFRPCDRNEARSFTKVSGTYTYIWIGHLNANKDPLLAVKAFSRFAEVEAAAHLYMVFQSGELLPQIRAWLEAHPVAAKQIHLIGKIEHADLEQWYNSVDFILSSSHDEAAGVSVTEGMSCGCIPVLSNIPSFTTMIAGNFGRLYEKGNEQALLEALQATTKMNIQEERSKTLQQYEQHLSFKAIANRIRTILQAL